MAERNTKERKLIALMLNDLASSMGHDDLSQAEAEVKALSDEEIDRTLASRLDLPYPTDEENLDAAAPAVEARAADRGRAPPLPRRRPGGPASCASRSRRRARGRPGTSPPPRT